MQLLVQAVSGIAMDHYLERMTRSGNWGDTAFLHALACACKVEACFQVKGGPVTFLHILWPSPAPVIKLFFFCITLTLALWSSWLGRLLLRRKLRGEETEVRIPQGHVLTNLMKMWQYWDRKMWESNLGSLGPPTALPSAIPLHHSHLFFSPFPCGSTCPLPAQDVIILQTSNTSDEPDVNVLVGTSLMSEDATALIPIALVNDHHFWALAPAEEQPSACLALNMERFEGNPLKMSVADGRDELEDEDLEPAS